MALDNSTHNMIKNTWDKSVNNMTNSISMDDTCMLNTSLNIYGVMTNYGDNVATANASQLLNSSDGYQSQIDPQTLQRAKSQKQLNTDPAVVNRASLIYRQQQQHQQQLQHNNPAKALDKRISMLEEASWSGNVVASTSRQMDRCSPPHL
jgi:hypothetical protein